MCASVGKPAVPNNRYLNSGDKRDTGDYQPPNQIPTPCTIPTGKNAADASSSGRQPFAAQKTIEVSQAEEKAPSTAKAARSVFPCCHAARRGSEALRPQMRHSQSLLYERLPGPASLLSATLHVTPNASTTDGPGDISIGDAGDISIGDLQAAPDLPLGGSVHAHRGARTRCDPIPRQPDDAAGQPFR